MKASSLDLAILYFLPPPPLSQTKQFNVFVKEIFKIYSKTLHIVLRLILVIF